MDQDRPSAAMPDAYGLFVTPALRLLQAELHALEALLPGHVHSDSDERRHDAAFEAETDNMPV